jgi:hypothetical protein
MQSITSHEVEKLFNRISLVVAPRMLKYLIQTGVGIQFDEVLSDPTLSWGSWYLNTSTAPPP